MKRYVLLFWLAFFFVVVGPLQARPADSRLYLPNGSVDAAALIGPPPAPDSPALEAQMAIVLWLQRTRTPAQVAFVQMPLNLARFAPILDDALLDVDGQQLKHTLDAAIDEVRADYDALKAVFDLKRPFQVNEAVHPATDARPVAAYPSGHAIRATVYARLLAEIFPDRTDKLMDLGLRIGYGRVIAGVHYPIDVLAGQKLGNAYADVIVEQPAFRNDVAGIRGEW